MSMEKFKEIMGDIKADVGAELGRLGKQGQAELASALFNGSAFVPYGEGQRSPQSADSQAIETPVVPQQQIESSGREM